MHVTHSQGEIPVGHVKAFERDQTGAPVEEDAPRRPIDNDHL